MFIYMGGLGNHPKTPLEIVQYLFQKTKTNSNRVLFFDNWYGSKDAAKFLISQNTKFVMCCRKDRPSELFGDCMGLDLEKKGDETSRYHKNLPLLAFAKFDKKKCFFFTNFSSTTKTTNKNKNTKKVTTKNKLIFQYNQGMGGVDLADQFLHTLLPFPHRRNKYTRVVFFAFFKFLFNNSFIIARTKFDAKLTMRKYSETILNEWIKKVMKNSKNLNWEEEVFFTKQKKHFPNYVSHHKFKKQLVCEFCKQNGKTSHTNFICPDCSIPLHPKCWVKYHDELAQKKLK